MIAGRIGIVGGAGQLGAAIGAALIDAGAVAPGRLWISSRSGRAAAFAGRDGVTVTADNAALARACDTILLAVPPAAAGAIGIAAPDRLVISVMAGIGLNRIAALTGAARVVRAMSSPAAARRLAYSPWVAAPAVTARDRAVVAAIFGACGLTDEIADEGWIDHFTALTGPVPGFVALFAEEMIRHATGQGIAPDIAERAVRQLFRGAGEILAAEPDPPAAHVAAMVAYAGTTAAGIAAMRQAGLGAAIAAGLAAAAERAAGFGHGRSAAADRGRDSGP